MPVFERARDEERAKETAQAIEKAVAARLEVACASAVEEARHAWQQAEEARFAALANVAMVEREGLTLTLTF